MAMRLSLEEASPAPGALGAPVTTTNAPETGGKSGGNKRREASNEAEVGAAASEGGGEGSDAPQGEGGKVGTDAAAPSAGSADPAAAAAAPCITSLVSAATPAMAAAAPRAATAMAAAKAGGDGGKPAKPAIEFKPRGAARGRSASVPAANGGAAMGGARSTVSSPRRGAGKVVHDGINMVIGTMVIGGGTSGSVERTVTVLRRPTGAWFYKRPNGKRSFIRTEHRVRVTLYEGAEAKMQQQQRTSTKSANGPTESGAVEAAKLAATAFGGVVTSPGGTKRPVPTGDRLIGTIVISPTGTNATGTVELRNVYERPVSGSWYYRRSGGGKGSLSKSQRHRVDLIDPNDEAGRETGNSKDEPGSSGAGSPSRSNSLGESPRSSAAGGGGGGGGGGGKRKRWSGGTEEDHLYEDERNGIATMVGYIEISLNRGNMTEWKEVFIRPSGAYYYHRSSGTKGFVTAAMRERVVKQVPPGGRRGKHSPLHDRSGSFSSSGSGGGGGSSARSPGRRPAAPVLNKTDDERVGRIELNRGSAMERRWTDVYLRASGSWYYLRSSGKRSFLRPEQKDRVVIENSRIARIENRAVDGSEGRARSASAGGYPDGFQQQMLKRARRAERSDSNSSESDYLSMQKAQWQRWKQRQMCQPAGFNRWPHFPRHFYRTSPGGGGGGGGRGGGVPSAVAAAAAVAALQHQGKHGRGSMAAPPSRPMQQLSTAAAAAAAAAAAGSSGSSSGAAPSQLQLQRDALNSLLLLAQVAVKED